MIITNFRLYENKQKAESILKKRKISIDNEDYVRLKNMLNGNSDITKKSYSNYLGQFTKWLIMDRTDFNTLEEVFKLLIQENIKLDKPIDTFETSEDLYDYIQKFEIDQRFKQIEKEFTKKSKKMVTQETWNLIKLNTEYYSEILSFLKKLKQYQSDSIDNLGAEALNSDITSLITNLKGDFNLEGMLKKFNELGVEILDGRPTSEQRKNDACIGIAIQTPNLLVIEVFNYKTSCLIGSKSWCISTSEHHWKSYVKTITRQYFLYDFTKLRSDKTHSIGITVSPDTITKQSVYTSMHWADDTTSGLTEEYIDRLITMNE